MNKLKFRKAKTLTEKELQRADLKANPSYEEKVQLERWYIRKNKQPFAFEKSQFKRLVKMINVALTEIEKPKPNELTLYNIEEGILKLVNETGISINRSSVTNLDCDHFNKNIVRHQASNGFNEGYNFMSGSGLINHQVTI